MKIFIPIRDFQIMAISLFVFCLTLYSGAKVCNLGSMPKFAGLGQLSQTTYFSLLTYFMIRFSVHYSRKKAK